MSYGMMDKCKCKGIMLVVFGVLFFLGTLGVWSEFTFAKYWPLVVIAFGLKSLICGGCCKKDAECCKKDGNCCEKK